MYIFCVGFLIKVQVEEVDSSGYKCFEEGGERLYRVWMNMNESKEDDLF